MVRKVLIQDDEDTPVQQYLDMPSLAEVMASGRDTGGREIENSQTDPDVAAKAALYASASGTGQADAYSTAVTEDGDAIVAKTATASGSGGADAKSTATSGSGAASVEAVATSTTGAASAGALAIRGAVASGIYSEVTGAGVAKIGFGAVAESGGVPIPEIGSTPDAQEIVDMLVLLGLITQAP